MRFLLYIQNARHFNPQDLQEIRSIIDNQSKSIEALDYLVKNIRISSEEVQIDIFVQGNKSREAKENQVMTIAKHLEKDIGSLNEKINLTDGLTVGLDDSAIIERVVRSFNNKRYWEGQETAEAIWNKTNNSNEKNVVQGLILVGAALVHYQRNEDEVCLSILSRARSKLQFFDQIPPDRQSFLQIDIQLLRKQVEDIIEQRNVTDISLKRIEF